MTRSRTLYNSLLIVVFSLLQGALPWASPITFLRPVRKHFTKLSSHQTHWKNVFHFVTSLGSTAVEETEETATTQATHLIQEESSSEQNSTKGTVSVLTILDTQNRTWKALNIPEDKFEAFLDYQGVRRSDQSVQKETLASSDTHSFREEWRDLWRKRRLVSDRTELLAVYPSDSSTGEVKTKRGGFTDLLHLYTERLMAILRDEEDSGHAHIVSWLQKEYGDETNDLVIDRFKTLPKDEQLAKLKHFLEWFRSNFPYFYDRCASCGASMRDEAHPDDDRHTFVGYVYPSEEELDGKASRTELYHCHKCSEMTRFPRFNSASFVMKHRRGRCGEYSMLLFRFLRALGHRSRWVVDWADHVWAETIVDDKWIHLDPCEAAVDENLIYQGWGKKQTYILGFYAPEEDDSLPLIEDVTASYTSDSWKDICDRREESEDVVRKSIIEASRNLKIQMIEHAKR